MEPGEKKVQMFNRKGRRSAATKKNGFRVPSGHFEKTPIELQQDGIQEGLSLVPVGRLFVKATVRTDLRAKRNVDVEVARSLKCLDSVLDFHEGEYNAASCSES